MLVDTSLSNGCRYSANNTAAGCYHSLAMLIANKNNGMRLGGRQADLGQAARSSDARGSSHIAIRNNDFNRSTYPTTIARMKDIETQDESDDCDKS